MDLASARSYLKEARELSGLASEAWVSTYDAGADANEISITDTRTGEIVPIAHVLPDCPFSDRELMLKAPMLLTATLTLLDEAFRIIKANQPPPQRSQGKRQTRRPDGDYAAECAMKCNEQAFRRYLMERHDLQDAGDSIRVESRVRSILNVTSRGELNHDLDAQERWFSLRADFENWMRDM